MRSWAFPCRPNAFHWVALNGLSEKTPFLSVSSIPITANDTSGASPAFPAARLSSQVWSIKISILLILQICCSTTDFYKQDEQPWSSISPDGRSASPSTRSPAPWAKQVKYNAFPH
eukprot:TRINITY_DN93922_c0_g1_i1.p1 TRINITY_DN93922_c0_g1~~TRINITY_DN93922_c0_g1_i1.p1  ORF type:complete len:116 (+),score=0.80 TRINITY_DN93922_c0_g1_i1:363-710(+)